MAEIADENQAELILTTGGTGFPRGMLYGGGARISAERKVQESEAIHCHPEGSLGISQLLRGQPDQ